MSFHGGFVGCVLAVVLFARSRGIPILTLGDITCAVAPIGVGLGRVANFINGELWGRPTDVPWAMVFPGGGPMPRDYGLTRIICEFFREPDPQLGFLGQGMTMGMLLSVPLILTGIAFIVAALKRPALHQA
jgi:phosphatidylglycerol:prolipoprotein diacylglycerol transferase